MPLPSKGRFITPEVDQTLIDNVSQLIADLGKPINVHLNAISQDCPNCGWDNLRKTSNRRYNSANPNVLNGPLHKQFINGRTCPICDGKGKLLTPQFTTVTGVILERDKELVEIEREQGLRYGTLSKTISLSEDLDLIYNHKEATFKGFVNERFSEPRLLGLDEQAFVTFIWKKKARAT